MSDLNQVGAKDNWHCWLCDQPVDADASVSSDLVPSVDNYAPPKAKKGASVERLAHRACNTMKGKIAPVVPWPALILACLAFMGMGAADEVSAIFRTAMLITAAPDEMRGRMQGAVCVGGFGRAPSW